MAETRGDAFGNQLDIKHLFPQAQHQWLDQAEIFEILKNYKKFRIASEPPNLPGSGSLFLFDRRVVYYRKDGHNWRKKKKNGKSVLVPPEDGSLEDLHCDYAYGEENESFQRRSYWMLEDELMCRELSHIALVHYLEVTGNRTDYNRNKGTEEPSCSRENEETTRSFQIGGSLSSSLRPNNDHLPSQTIDIQQLLVEAEHRWLRPAEICEILKIYKKFRIASKPPNLPGSGSLFLFDRKVLKYFRKDGHNWKKKPGGNRLNEAHVTLKVGSIEVLHGYYAHGEENDRFQRRSSWMLEEELSHIALVHYLEVKGNRTDYNRNKGTEEPS